MPAEKAITIPGSLIGGAMPHVANQETSDETARGRGQKRLHPHRGGATIGVLGWKCQLFIFSTNPELDKIARNLIQPICPGTVPPG
jgi:hypothetical protein